MNAIKVEFQQLLAMFWGRHRMRAVIRKLWWWRAGSTWKRSFLAVVRNEWAGLRRASYDDLESSCDR